MANLGSRHFVSNEAFVAVDEHVVYFVIVIVRFDIMQTY
jgi:hypothetical protein